MATKKPTTPAVKPGRGSGHPSKDKKMTIEKQEDSFMNLEKGLGGSKDATVTTSFARTRFIDFKTINDMYATDWLAAKVVDTPVNEAYREGRFIVLEDQDKRTTFEDGIKKLKVDQKFSTATKWARAFGGAVVIPIFEGQDLGLPLIVENIKQGSLKNIIVLDRFDVFPQDINITNPLAENFLEPEFYTISQGNTKIHYTRVIKFEGTFSTNEERKRSNYFGLSIYDRIFRTIMESQTSSDFISNLVFQSNVDVIKMNGLNELLATKGGTDLAIERARIASRLKSNLNMLVLDGEDDYTNIAKSFAGLAEIDTKFFEKVAGSSGIPVTKLLGTSAEGMSATGEGDLKNYYDMVRSDIQTEMLTPKYEIIDPIMSMHLFGEDIGVKFEWESLWQMSESEQATMNMNKSTTDSNYFDRGIIDDTDIRARLAESGTYPTITLEVVAEEIDELKDMDSGAGEE